MSSWSKPAGHALRVCGDALLSLFCWSLWLALGLTAALQIGIAVSRQLTVPAFVLRAFEERLNASHIHARFGRATFDPAGAILVEHLTLSLPEFSEPVATTGGVYIELDPWALLTGRFEPRRISATGLTLYIPAMLSPSGGNEEILKNLELTVQPGDDELAIEQLTAHLAGVSVEVHGAIDPRPLIASRGGTKFPLLETFASNYAAICRQLIKTSRELQAFEKPELHVVLAPSPSRAAIASITLSAREVKLPQFHDASATDLLVTTRFPLLGDSPAMSVLTASIKQLRVGSLATGTDIQAHFRGALNPSSFTFNPSGIEVTFGEIVSQGFSIQHLSGQISVETRTRFGAEVVASSFGSAFSLSAATDLAAQTSTLQFDGALAPALLDPIGALLKADLHRFIGFGEPLLLHADVRFNPGWKFGRIKGHLDVRQVDAYHVAIDRAYGEIEFDGRHFTAREATAVLGDNHASGSFEQDLVTRGFRFLLEGQLRPLAISGWFREWWPAIFQPFEFPRQPPNASVDVQGDWFRGNDTTVFVFADSAFPTIRGVKFDQARTILFIRPHFLDGLEAFGTRGAGDVSGTFVRRVNLETNEWSEFALSLASTLDLEAGASLLGPTLAPQLAPYSFENSPRVKFSGQFNGPGAAPGARQTMKIEAQSTGAFTAYKLPGRNLSFVATMTDDDLELDAVHAEIGGGALTVKALVSGSGKERRLGFDAELRGAALGEAVTTVINFVASHRAAPQTSPERILPGKSNVKLDLSLAADGLLEDPYSFKGSGNGSLAGGSLGEVRLLGMLSELFNFTALRFNAARADFKLMGSKVSFPSVSITGSNSAIEGHGDYYLDRRELDFNARVYPFQESKSLFQNVVGAVLTPFSAVFEVKLTGALDQPNWAFVIGPTNFFRSLTQSDPAPLPDKPVDAARYLKRAP
jgi:hypothetical protein